MTLEEMCKFAEVFNNNFGMYAANAVVDTLEDNAPRLVITMYGKKVVFDETLTLCEVVGAYGSHYRYARGTHEMPKGSTQGTLPYTAPRALYGNKVEE